MTEKSTIKNTYNIFSLFGLVLLLLLSPCKVRNFIQMELGVPQTEVANKSQTTFNYSNCTAFDFTKNTLVKKQNTLKNIPAITSDFKFEFVTASSFNNYTQPHVSRNHSVSRVPLYILYQNFKDYL